MKTEYMDPRARPVGVDNNARAGINALISIPMHYMALQVFGLVKDRSH